MQFPTRTALSYRHMFQGIVSGLTKHYIPDWYANLFSTDRDFTRQDHMLDVDWASASFKQDQDLTFGQLQLSIVWFANCYISPTDDECHSVILVSAVSENLVRWFDLNEGNYQMLYEPIPLHQ
jgi:hypothetical protein